MADSPYLYGPKTVHFWTDAPIRRRLAVRVSAPKITSIWPGRLPGFSIRNQWSREESDCNSRLSRCLQAPAGEWAPA